MARPSATAALLLLLFSLVAVAHCRPVEPQQPATDADSSAAGDDDENGPPNPILPAEADQVILPAEDGFLRLPSHRLRRHGPFHRHLWWARHHGAFGNDAPRRFHHHHHHDAEVPSHLAVAHEVSEAGEPRAVAEPDPDHAVPYADGEGEPSFGDADGVHEEEGAAMRAWKKEMMRRWFHHHHGMRHHRLHREEDEGHEQEEEAMEGSLKRFHHGRRHHDEDEEKEAMRKRFRGGKHGEDSDDENDEVEEIVRRFRKAMMRRRFGHGQRFHHRHHHRHRHDEDVQEEGGVVSWIKGLMNRF